MDVGGCYPKMLALISGPTKSSPQQVHSEIFPLAMELGRAIIFTADRGRPEQREVQGLAQGDPVTE